MKQGAHILTIGLIGCLAPNLVHAQSVLQRKLSLEVSPLRMTTLNRLEPAVQTHLASFALTSSDLDDTTSDVDETTDDLLVEEDHTSWFDEHWPILAGIVGVAALLTAFLIVHNATNEPETVIHFDVQ